MNIPRIALLVSIGSCALGCGGTAQSLIDARKSVQEAFNAAEAAFDGKDFAVAEKEYTNALEAGGLYPDLLDIAMVKRAVSRANLGNLDQAMADLTELERYAMQMDLVYAAQSFVLAKQGKKREASAAWNKARQINRAVEQYSD
jgi:tetratricopeptide (TPR) repeat protein